MMREAAAYLLEVVGEFVEVPIVREEGMSLGTVRTIKSGEKKGKLCTVEIVVPYPNNGHVVLNLKQGVF